LTNIYYNFIETFKNEVRGNKKDNKKSKKKEERNEKDLNWFTNFRVNR